MSKGKDWKEQYQKKFTTAENVSLMVKSGDTIAFTAGREAHSPGLAIAARKSKLKGVKVYTRVPGYDFG